MVWLDYSLARTFWQLLQRTMRRLFTREELWAGNRESWKILFSRQSIIIWLFQTYWRRRREYSELLSLPQYSHLKVIRIAHPRELEIHL